MGLSVASQPDRRGHRLMVQLVKLAGLTFKTLEKTYMPMLVEKRKVEKGER